MNMATGYLLCFWETGKKQTELNKKQQQILESLQIKIGDTIRTDIEYDGIVDAMLGIRITRGLSGTFAEAVETVNQMDAFKLAIGYPDRDPCGFRALSDRSLSGRCDCCLWLYQDRTFTGRGQICKWQGSISEAVA